MITIEFISDKSSDIKIAAPKLEKEKFCSPTITDVNFNIIPFITKLNKPNVMSVIGSDKICNMGFTNTFNADKTTLATMAIIKLLT